MPGARGFAPTCDSVSTGLPPTGRRPSGESSAADNIDAGAARTSSTAEGELARARAGGAPPTSTILLSGVGARAPRSARSPTCKPVPSKPAARRCSTSFAGYDLIDDEQARPTYAEIAGVVGHHDHGRDQSPRGDAQAVPATRPRSPSRPHVERRGMGGGGYAAARPQMTQMSCQGAADLS